ncbi:MAG: GIY-YIG nuclease family protein [Verrucomicrobiales bacterium]|nr:GIY-YIG nuclease family protein [Verrucomicrobiales bacterium]
MSIPISTIIRLENPNEFKFHAARWNKHVQPLDEYVRDKREWLNWNKWRNPKNEFNRKYIFSLIDFYHTPDIWLFGGIFEVLDCAPEFHAHSYELREVEEFKALVGRLKIFLPKPSRGRAFLLEKHFDKMEVHEILPSIYTGEPFPGYENIDIDFSSLASVYRNQRQDWQAALQSIKGVYLITDKSNGKKYVGSAYGEFGIWSRWACYVGTGHGWNDELTSLIEKKGYDYALKNYKVTLLEYRPKKTSDSEVISRETFWKEALLSRGEYGYNKN